MPQGQLRTRYRVGAQCFLREWRKQSPALGALRRGKTGVRFWRELSGLASMVGSGRSGDARLASTWEPPGLGGSVLCKAAPKPLAPELQPLSEQEGTKGGLGKNSFPLRAGTLSFRSQGAQALAPSGRRPGLSQFLLQSPVPRCPPVRGESAHLQWSPVRPRALRLPCCYQQQGRESCGATSLAASPGSCLLCITFLCHLIIAIIVIMKKLCCLGGPGSPKTPGGELLPTDAWEEALSCWPVLSSSSVLRVLWG